MKQPGEKLGGQVGGQPREKLGEKPCRIDLVFLLDHFGSVWARFGVMFWICFGYVLGMRWKCFGNV